MKRDSLEDFQRAVNKLAEHAEAMRSGCISAYCWVEWHAGLSAARRSETAFISVALERVRLMSQVWRNYERIIRESWGGEAGTWGREIWPHSSRNKCTLRWTKYRIRAWRGYWNPHKHTTTRTCLSALCLYTCFWQTVNPFHCLSPF